jgi:hypothetical protein
MQDTFFQCVAQPGPGGPTEPPEYTGPITPQMSDEEYAALEEEVAQQPTPKGTSQLEVTWDDFVNQSGTLAGNELTVADLATGKLYSMYVQPGTDVSNPRIIIYPVIIRYVDDYSSAETFEPLPDGSLDWQSIEKKYFPNGFTKVDKNTKQEILTSSRKIPDGFWHKVLANLLHNFSAKSFYNKNINNPYIVKRNK